MSGQPTIPELLPDETQRRALLEAIVYVAEDPLTLEQIAGGLELPQDVVEKDLDAMMSEYGQSARGIEIRMIAGGYKMSTKAEHHEGVRGFVPTLRPKLKLSLPALETVAVIAYKQPITLPEIQAIRGVNVTGVIHTLLDRKLITTAGRKKVIGRPMLYRTTKEFLIQFGLKDLSELPSLKEFEELSRGILGEGEEDALAEEPAAAEEAAPDQAVPDEAAAAAESVTPDEAPAVAQAPQPGAEETMNREASSTSSETENETADSHAETAT